MEHIAAAALGIIDMLKEDHKKVINLFEDFESAERREHAEIATRALMELEVHIDVEEKLIYPAIRGQFDGNEMINEAVEQHRLVHVLMKELKKLTPKDEVFQAKFKVLTQLVHHHIKEEEGEMLPKAHVREIEWDKLETAVIKRRYKTMKRLTMASKQRGMTA